MPLPDPPSVVIVGRPGARTQSILGWLRQLMPAALLVVASANPPPPIPPEVVVVDEQDVASGPLSLAHALTRGREPESTPVASAFRDDPDDDPDRS